MLVHRHGRGRQPVLQPRGDAQRRPLIGANPAVIRSSGRRGVPVSLSVMTITRRPLMAAALSMSVAALMVCMLLAIASAADAPAAQPSPATLPANPAVDSRMKTYIVKRFMLGDSASIELGPSIATAMPGVAE